MRVPELPASINTDRCPVTIYSAIACENAGRTFKREGGWGCEEYDRKENWEENGTDAEGGRRGRGRGGEGIARGRRWQDMQAG